MKVDLVLEWLRYCPHENLETNLNLACNKSNECNETVFHDIIEEIQEKAAATFVTVGTWPVEFYVRSVFIVAICCIGVVGNVLSIAILTHRSRQRSVRRMERFNMIGLAGLAVSDLCFCLCVIPRSFVRGGVRNYDALGFNILYEAYAHGLINIWILSSTLMIVYLALTRYQAVNDPLNCHASISPKMAPRMIVASVCVSVVANLPRFWFPQINEHNVLCYYDTTVTVYTLDEGYMRRHETLYLSVYFVIAICAPFLLLVYCNVVLLRRLKDSLTLFEPTANEGLYHERKRDSRRLTLCLVTIIISYLLLVVPGEVIMFCKELLVADRINTDAYNLPVLVCMCMQAVNFSFNFVIYCSLNKYVRRTLRDAVCCCCDKRRQRRYGRRSGGGSGNLTQSSFATRSRSTMTTSNGNSMHLLTDRHRHQI